MCVCVPRERILLTFAVHAFLEHSKPQQDQTQGTALYTEALNIQLGIVTRMNVGPLSLWKADSMFSA